jgi:hypothetical protein
LQLATDAEHRQLLVGQTKLSSLDCVSNVDYSTAHRVESNSSSSVFWNITIAITLRGLVVSSWDHGISKGTIPCDHQLGQQHIDTILYYHISIRTLHISSYTMSRTIVTTIACAAFASAQSTTSIDIDAISVAIPTTVFNLPIVYVTAEDAPVLTATTLPSSRRPRSP